MSGLEDATANALEAAVHAERHPPPEPASTEGIPTPVEAGYVSEIHIERGEN
jgi:hypothetical protein